MEKKLRPRRIDQTNNCNMINEFKPIVSPYFGEVGLTSTSAQTYANRAKHQYELLEELLDKINFVEVKFGLIGTNESNFTIAQEANKNVNFNDINDTLKQIVRYKSFIAFLREAIKEKDRLAREVDTYSSPERATLCSPIMATAITESEIIDNMTVKDRQTYLTLETKCAVYGKFIHPNRPFDNAIKWVEKAMGKPRAVDYNGRDTIITTYTPTVDINKLNSIYDDLQREHRKAEASLNGIKHEIEKKIEADVYAKTDAYEKAVEEYKIRLNEISISESKVKDARRKEIQNLKIVIPNEFKDLYENLK